MSDIVLRQAETDAEVAACFPVMVQLRPHLASAEELVARVARQRETGYCILAAWCDGKPVALAGYREAFREHRTGQPWRTRRVNRKARR
jgi:hypothetical protein